MDIFVDPQQEYLCMMRLRAARQLLAETVREA